MDGLFYNEIVKTKLFEMEMKAIYRHHRLMTWIFIHFIIKKQNHLGLLPTIAFYLVRLDVTACTIALAFVSVSLLGTYVDGLVKITVDVLKVVIYQSLLRPKEIQSK